MVWVLDEVKKGAHTPKINQTIQRHNKQSDTNFARREQLSTVAETPRK